MAIHIGGIHGTAVTTCSAVAHEHMLTVEKLVPYGRNLFLPFNGNWDPIEAIQGKII